MEEIIVALIFTIAVSNGVWFIYYKQSVQKQIDILKEYNKSLESHKDYLEKQEIHSKYMQNKLNETVKLVTENILLRTNN